MPGSNSLTLAWNLLATDGASPAFDKVAASADRAAASTEAAATKTEATGLSLSKLATVGAVAGVAFAAAAVKMASDFQRQMTLIQTQAGASADEVKKMTPAILSLAGQTAQAPEALATSLYHVESTGLRGAAALEAVKIAAEGARVGHADLEETTNALTATIASGMLPATESYAQAMGQLNTIVGSGDMKLADLNQALGTGVLVQVKQYGISINDVGAALADFGDNNIRGADAATMLRMAVQAIAKPGVNAAEALGKIGLTVGQLQSDEQTGGLNKALTDLHTHFVNSGIDASQWGAIMTDAFTKKAGGGIITLIGTYDRFEQKYKEVQKGADSFAQDWAATQKTAAFQAAALKDNIDAMTISIGDHLLPIATGAMSWINGTAVPALKGLGSGAMDVAHWFGELPAPIKDTALALGGLALANAIGLTSALAGGISRVGSAFTGAGGAVSAFGDDMALQSRLAAMEATSLSDVDRALGAVSGSAARAAGSLTAAQVSMTSGAFAGWDLALSGVAVEEDVVAASTSRLGAAMSTLAIQGQRAGAGILSALGGGPGLAIGATLILLPQLIDGFKLLAGNVIDTTAATEGFTQALEQTNGVIDASIDKTVAQQLQQNNLVGVFQKAGISAKDAVAGIEGNADAQHRVNQELQDYIDKQDFLGKHGGITDAANLAATKAAYNQLVSSFSTSAEAAKYFAAQMAEGSSNTTSAGQAATDAAPKLEYAGSAAGMSADAIKAANKEWETWIKNLAGLAQGFVDPLQTYEDLLSQKQQAEQASAQATADSTKSSKDSWKDYVKNVSVSLSEEATQLEGQIKNEQDWQKNLVTIAQRGGVGVAQAFADMGVKGADLTAQMANATNGDFNRMAQDMITQTALGGQGAAATLDEKMRVMAEIGAEGGKATADSVSQALGLGINDVANIASQYGVTLATGFEPVLSALGKQTHLVIGGPSGRGQVGALADGGYITGPGTGRSDSILSYLSNGEFVVNAAATAKHRPLLEALNAPKFAAGGFVTAADVPHPYSTAPFGALVAYPSDATMSTEYDAATAFLKSMAFAPGAPANVAANAALARQMAAQFYGWTGAEWNALYAVGQRESGWNNNAQNPTSTAYGIPQFLNSTWATVGLSKTSDPATQIAGMLKYIQQRYRDPIGAWAHEMSAGWYRDGTNYVPSDQLAFLHKGEAVVPASANQGAPWQGGPAVFKLYDSDNHLIGTMTGVAERVTAGALDSVHGWTGA